MEMPVISVRCPPTESWTSEAPDRRGSPRRQLFKRAQIVFRDGHCSMAAEIFDISETGVQLAPLDPFLCPKQFTLASREERARRCEVVWRRGSRIGVRYL
jgi:PilZ domain